jgi:hypothetical protein
MTMLLQVADKAPQGQVRKFHAKTSAMILGSKPCLKRDSDQNREKGWPLSRGDRRGGKSVNAHAHQVMDTGLTHSLANLSRDSQMGMIKFAALKPSFYGLKRPQKLSYKG